MVNGNAITYYHDEPLAELFDSNYMLYTAHHNEKQYTIQLRVQQAIKYPLNDTTSKQLLIYAYKHGITENSSVDLALQVTTEFEAFNASNIGSGQELKVYIPSTTVQGYLNEYVDERSLKDGNVTHVHARGIPCNINHDPRNKNNSARPQAYNGNYDIDYKYNTENQIGRAHV